MIFLTTKFQLPAARPQSLARSRLIEGLELGLQKNKRLTLLVAPAGFGKTTSLSNWLNVHPHPVAWLSLDENDRFLPRFLFYLVGALQTQLPGMGEEILNFLQSEQEPPVEAILTALLNAAAQSQSTLVLVLEDYHLVSNPKTDAAVAFLLEYLPPQLHLVLSSREDPVSLPLSRLRVRDQLTELRAEELRFTQEEAATFLEGSTGLKLSSRQIALLEERTEGWIAGLQLAALSLSGQADAEQFIAGFSGSHRYVMDYLVDEVLVGQSEELVEFLLQTALLRRMSGELCDALLTSPPGQGQQTLERLEAHNLFVVKLDQVRQWFRYHHLFGDLLMFRLLRRFPPAWIIELHLRAGRWYLAHQEWDEAIFHTVQAQQGEAIVNTLRLAIEATIGDNELNQALAWFESIEEDILRQTPTLALYKSWVLALASQTALSAHYAALSQALLPPNSSELELGLLEATLAYNARLQLDIPLAITHSGRALALIGQNAPLLRNIMLMLLGQAKLLLPPSFDEGMQLVREALENAQHLGNHFVLFNSLSTLIFVLIGQARIREALLLLDQFDQRYSNLKSDKIKSPLAWVFTLRATIYYLTNELEKARQELARVIKTEPSSGLEWLTHPWAYMVQALIYQAEGQRAQALDIFSRVEASQVALPPTIRATPFKITLLLESGRQEEATLWVETEGLTPNDPITPEKDDYYLCYARLLTIQKRYEEALQVLRTLEELESSLSIHYRLATVHVLQAIVYLKSQRRSSARDYLTKAVLLVAPSKLFRTFLNEDPLIVDLLAETRPVASKFVDALLAMYRQPKVETTPLLEPLSEREQEILRLIAQGLSNREIGERLFLAVGTVKRHAVNIFGKLGVNSRTEAVAQARELGLL